MRKLILLPVLFVLIVSQESRAQDRMFNYVYQSLVLNKGQKELEIWTTLRTGREDYYRRLDARAEFEIGLGKRLQTAFYLNYSSKAAGYMIGDTLAAIENEGEFSFSNEWKYKFSDPVANAIGSALYGEVTVSATELELEAKMILDKRIGRVTQALNLSFEPEWAWAPSGAEITAGTEYKFEFSYAFGANLGKGFSLGAELLNPNVYTVADGWAHSAIYAGPTLSYSGDNFWINVTFMPQVAGLRGITPGQGLNLSEYERYQARVLFSYAL
jgi:hypothetical protein